MNKTSNYFEYDQIDHNRFEVKPTFFVQAASVIVLCFIFIWIIFVPFENSFRWPIILFFSLFLLGFYKAFFKKNYMVTLISNRTGLYIYCLDLDKYFFIPWNYVGIINKVTYPLNSRGLGIEVDCSYIENVKNKIGNVVKKNDKCFIYTSAQLLNRDKVIKKIEDFRKSKIIIH